MRFNICLVVVLLWCENTINKTPSAVMASYSDSSKLLICVAIPIYYLDIYSKLDYMYSIYLFNIYNWENRMTGNLS